MRALVWVLLAVAAVGCSRPRPAAAVTAPAASAALPTAPISFAATVQPLLARTCTPCHVPDGKMYAKLPFDQPTVVQQNAAGVLRRLKDPKDHATVEAWLATLAP